MYDTVVLKSPEINTETVTKLLQFCRLSEGIDIFTGELLYAFTSGELEGSYDYRIRFKVDNTEWEKEETLVPVRVKSYWHIVVECSLHKLLINHNCYGGPREIKKSVKYLVNFLESVTSVSLPDYKQWEVKRIDVSKIFIFRNKEICKKIVDNLKNAYYTRRKPRIYDTSVMFSGSTTTVKLYWKGPEFKKHDYKRLVKYINREIDLNWNKENHDLIMHKLALLKMEYDNILEKAYRIIRFECEIKAKKLKDLFKKEVVFVSDLDDKILHKISDDELFRLMKERCEEMDIVRRSDLVLERLHNLYGFNLGNSLYSTWAQLVQFGEERTKNTMSKPTFYRHKKQLIEAGCSWFCSTLKLQQFSIVPEDFSFCDNKYVDDTVDKEVIKKLEKVA
ncbi:MAG: hypothetical protein GX935_00610 [Erysipelotrichia bacterium]|nr:hypothetical protein [Erysipelotrichia bacterium]